MFKTIKSKFIVLSLIVIILSIGIPVGFLLNQVSKNFHERSILMIEAAIDLMIDGLNDSMMKGDSKNVQKIVEQISKKTAIDHIRIFNKAGTIKYANEKEVLGKDINVIEPGHIEKDITKIVKREVYLDKVKNVYKAIQPIIIEERCQTCHKDDTIISYLDVDTDFTKAEIKFYTGSYHMLFLGAGLIIILAVCFYLVFDKLINKPLNNFTKALEEVEKGNLNTRLPSKGKDEFSVLNYHYNQMVNKLRYSSEKISEMHFEQLQRAEKMVTLGELTSSLAHDINNHSGIIMSRADYLLHEAENNSFSSSCIDDLKVVNNQIEKISKITGNILRHSKKNAKTIVDFDLVQVINNTTEMMLPLIKKRKIKIVREIELSSVNLKGDPNQIEQLLMNLISNAIDAVENEGIINVGLKLSEKKKVILTVNDNGIGINEESINKIFSPFYSKKEANKGTGLGLYIVQKICKEHNAEIICDSKLNEGTTFTVEFNGEGNNG